MSKIPVLNAIRLIPREGDYLNRKSGSRGEIYFDIDTNTLRLYTGAITGGISLAKSDLSNVSNADFSTKAAAAGISGGGGSGSGGFELVIAADDSTARTITSGNTLQFVGGDGISTTTSEDGTLTITNDQLAFNTFAISGQTNVVADTTNDQITFVAGSNITLSTSGKSIEISAAAGASTNSFSTISVSGQTSLIADSGTDTLTLVAGSGISIATNDGSDTITITNSQSPGITTVSAATDATNASLTVDKFYLPAITKLAVTNNGASAYRFDQYGTIDNPTIYALNRTTIAFDLNILGHPFLIQTGAGANYNTGLIHVATNGTVTTGASAQGHVSGTLYWKIPENISGGYRYQCSAHVAMVGSITIKDLATV
jgi:hypothetical protein